MKKKNIKKVIDELEVFGYLEINNKDREEIINQLHESLNKKDTKDIDEIEEFRWENCVENDGYFYDQELGVNILFDTTKETNAFNKNAAPTESIIKSNIAACKLSWIIKKINEKYPVIYDNTGVHLVYDFLDDVPRWSICYKPSLPRLNNHKVFDVLIKTNLPLIKEYFGIE